MHKTIKIYLNKTETSYLEQKCQQNKESHVYNECVFKFFAFKLTFVELESTVSGRRYAEVKTSVKLLSFCHTTACYPLTAELSFIRK